MWCVVQPKRERERDDAVEMVQVLLFGLCLLMFMIGGASTFSKYIPPPVLRVVGTQVRRIYINHIRLLRNS